MNYTNSPLTTYTLMSPYHSGLRTHAIDRITPHCVVGQTTTKRTAEIFQTSGASCNYGIGTEGGVALICDESCRSWCTSSRENDQRAITIECASDNFAPYAFNHDVYSKLIELCADICRRYGKTKLLWIPDKNAALSYEPKADEMLLTAHRWFAAKSCPGDWLYNREGELANAVNAKLGTPALPVPDVTAPVVPPVTAFPVENNEKAIWTYLKGKDLNDFAVAGIMGNLYAESGLNPCNLQNSYEARLGYTDITYTQAVDDGTYGNFVNDSAGYGLAQWTYYTRKQALLDYAKSINHSIGSIVAQLDFLWKELQGYGRVMGVLKAATSVSEVSDAILTDYERPADQSSGVKAKRASFGQVYYDRYAGSKMTANKLYRVRKSWDDGASQLGAFANLENAKKLADENPGYSVFDSDGVVVHNQNGISFEPYKVRVTANALNIRSGSGVNSQVVGVITDGGIYTIVEKVDGTDGYTWGKLKSGAGWICLDYTEKCK